MPVAESRLFLDRRRADHGHHGEARSPGDHSVAPGAASQSRVRRSAAALQRLLAQRALHLLIRPARHAAFGHVRFVECSKSLLHPPSFDHCCCHRRLNLNPSF